MTRRDVLRLMGVGAFARNGGTAVFRPAFVVHA